MTRQLLADMERQQKAARGVDGSAAGEEERDQLVGARRGRGLVLGGRTRLLWNACFCMYRHARTRAHVVLGGGAAWGWAGCVC